MDQLYDALGVDYRRWRRPDPRLAAQIAAALGSAESVVNVGAGAGAYEPRDRRVVAVEPALTMIRQRPPDAAPAVRGCAGALPVRSGAVDAALAVLSLHHWPDWERGVAELARVARRRVVMLTWDPEASGRWWMDEYFPEIQAIDGAIFPPLDWYGRQLGAVTVTTVPIPHDCSDGFLGAYWRRPAVYLDAGARRAISSFARFDPAPGLARLRRDLASGAWRERHGHLLERQSLDLGYRLVVAARDA